MIKKKKRNGPKKGREERKRKKRKGKEVWTGQVLFSELGDI